jgi:hypothetical protein
MHIHSEPESLNSVPIENKVLKKQHQYISKYPLLLQFIDAISTPVMILNKQRQVIYSNRALLSITGKTDIEVVLGMLPGDVFNCTHAVDKHKGCGSTEFCITCGALKSILSAADPLTNVQECRIIKTDNDALDLRVFSSPMNIDGEEFIVFTISDISDEKRRKNLERIFFHDLLNTASTLKAFAFNMEKAPKEEAEEFRSHLLKLSDKLVDEICAQRDIYAAENNELAVYFSRYNSIVLLNDIFEQFNYYRNDKKIIIDPEADNCDFFTDKVLIRRILSNMVKNAIEATTANNVVTIGCKKFDEKIELWVHNPGHIEKEIQLQIFQRSFSTKGHGRGIGTYSMKILCENYLKGKISFISSPSEGTIFKCTLPFN